MKNCLHRRLFFIIWASLLSCPQIWAFTDPRNATLEDIAGQAKLAFSSQDWKGLASQRRTRMPELIPEKQAFRRAFPKDDTKRLVSRWYRRLCGSHPGIQDPLDPVVVNTAFASVITYLDISSGQKAVPADSYLHRGVVPQDVSAASWIPAERAQSQSECTFTKENYKALEVAVDVYLDKNSSWTQMTGYPARMGLQTIENAVIGELNITDVVWCQHGNMQLMPESTYILFDSLSLMPSKSYRISFLMEGPCLFPFGVEKQTVTEMVLEQLLGEKTNAYYVKIDEVLQAMHQKGRNDVVLLHLSVALYEERLLASVTEAFSTSGRGILAGSADGNTRFSNLMLQHGLIIASAEASNITDRTGMPPLTPDDWLNLRRSEDAGKLDWSWISQVTAMCTGVALLAGVLGCGLLYPHFIDQLHYSFSLPRSGPNSRQRSYGSCESRELSTLSSLTELDIEWDKGTLHEDDVEILCNSDGSPVVLGTGAAGQVFKGLLHRTVEVAIKVFADTLADSPSRTNFMREVKLLSRCRNSHIVQFLGSIFKNGDVWLVMECMAGGNLYKSLRMSDASQWTKGGASIALDVARGMAFLHAHSVIHLDLKSPNILLTRDGASAKIADVGLAHLLHDSSTHASNLMQGTFDWMAPEVLCHGRAGYSADVFSFGVILWELVTLEMPRRGRLTPPRVPEECSAEAAQLIKDCLNTDPAQRPTSKEIVNRLLAMQTEAHPFALSESSSVASSIIMDKDFALFAEGMHAHSDLLAFELRTQHKICSGGSMSGANDGTSAEQHYNDDTAYLQSYLQSPFEAMGQHSWFPTQEEREDRENEDTPLEEVELS